MLLNVIPSHKARKTVLWVIELQASVDRPGRVLSNEVGDGFEEAVVLHVPIRGGKGDDFVDVFLRGRHGDVVSADARSCSSWLYSMLAGASRLHFGCLVVKHTSSA